MSNINKQTAINELEKRFQQTFKKLGYEDYNSADERTQLVCDGILEAIDVIDTLPSAQPEYKPVTAEDFAKTMSENSPYSFIVWHGWELALMKEYGFVICKKTI